MSRQVAIICSTADPASINIADHLIETWEWEEREGYRASGDSLLIIQDEDQTRVRDIEARIAGLGISPDVLVFACRHKSESGRPWLGGHFTGTVSEGRADLSTASPPGLRSFLHNLSTDRPEGFGLSLEATHHGPVDLRTPSFFAEIGSGESQWVNQEAGAAVARAIMGLDLTPLPAFLGFGGGHYMQRQTGLLFEAGITFGHLFSTYQIGDLGSEAIELARGRSGAAYAFIDRKSMKAEERNRISRILDEIGLSTLRSREIRREFPVGACEQRAG